MTIVEGSDNLIYLVDEENGIKTLIGSTQGVRVEPKREPRIRIRMEMIERENTLLSDYRARKHRGCPYCV